MPCPSLPRRLLTTVPFPPHPFHPPPTISSPNQILLSLISCNVEFPVQAILAKRRSI
jgi:hypothetical protein